MHQFPPGPPASVRIRSAMRRWALASGSVFSFRPRRAVPVLVVGMAAGVIALAVPVLSDESAPVSLDSSASNSANGVSPVRLGVDGAPAPDAARTAQRRAPASVAGATSTGRSTVAGRTLASPSRVVRSAGAAPSVKTAGPAGTARASSPSSTDPSAVGSSAAGAPSSTTSSSSTSSSGSPTSVSPSGSASVPPSSASDPAPAADAVASSSPTRTRSENGAVLDLVNAARDAAGCGTLTRDDDLAAAARRNSTDMAAQGSAAVVDPAGTAAAVSAGRPDAASVVDAWLADDTDRAALLDCSLTSAGVGEVGPDGGPWWTIFLS